MTLTDIIGYLPHGLVGVSNGGDIAPIDIYTLARHGIKLDGHKPVLRPMTDLITEITEKGYNNGKPFVPIVELTKAAYPDALSVDISGGGCSAIAPTRYGFVYEYSIFWHGLEHGFYAQVYAPYRRTSTDCPHQVELYDLLHAWHFDYRGLIEQGDAVNVHDLEKTPYEN